MVWWLAVGQLAWLCDNFPWQKMLSVTLFPASTQSRSLTKGRASRQAAVLLFRYPSGRSARSILASNLLQHGPFFCGQQPQLLLTGAKPRKYLHTFSVGQRGYCTIPPLTGQRGYVRPGGRWAGHTPSDLSKGVGYTPSALPIRYEKYTIILPRSSRGSMENWFDWFECGYSHLNLADH